MLGHAGFMVHWSLYCGAGDDAPGAAGHDRVSAGAAHRRPAWRRCLGSSSGFRRCGCAETIWAIVTLGFGEIIRVVIQNMTITGGGRGLYGIEEYTTFPWVFWITVLGVAFMYAMIYTRQGLAILSLRENEIAARERRHPCHPLQGAGLHRVLLLCRGSGRPLRPLHHRAGSRYLRQSILSIEILVMVVLGGVWAASPGRCWRRRCSPHCRELLRGFSDYRMLIYSILLVVMMILRPQGLLGKREFSLDRLWRKRPPGCSGGGKLRKGGTPDGGKKLCSRWTAWASASRGCGRWMM